MTKKLRRGKEETKSSCDNERSVKLRLCCKNLKRLKYAKLLNNLKSMTNISFLLDKLPKRNYAVVHFQSTEDSKLFFNDVNGKFLNSNCLKLEQCDNQQICSTPTQGYTASKNLNAYLLADQILQSFIHCPENLFAYSSSLHSRQLMNDSSSNLYEKVTPFMKFSYPLQLDIKKKYLTRCIKKITRSVFHILCPSFRSSPSLTLSSEHSDNQEMHSVSKNDIVWCSPEICKGFLGCQVASVLPSPKVLYYRNKCEFTIGYSELFGSQDTVEIGFVKRIVNHNPIVGSCSGILNVPYCMQEFCYAFKMFVQRKYDVLPVYCRRGHTGFWKLLMVRCSEDTRRLMVVVQVASPSLNASTNSSTEYYDGLMKSLKQELISSLVYSNTRDTLTRKAYDGYTIESLYLQQRSNFSDAFEPTDPLHLIYGEPHITFQIFNCSFHVAPLSFFQTNSQAAALLYSEALKMCYIREGGLILDVCCGVGTIGICLQHYLRQRQLSSRIIGIEVVESAVRDANNNAVLNNATDIEFICGKAQDVLPSLLQTISPETVVTVLVDPPRSGLCSKLLALFVHYANIHRVVYISCNPDLLVHDAIKLCTPTLSNPIAFKPIQCMPVDLFPLTHHCETIVRFERNIGV